MAGLEVTRNLLDMKSADAIIAVREAFEKVETIAKFLSNLPADATTGDPLTADLTPKDPNDPRTMSGFGYTDDEAYLIRYLFESLSALDIQPLLDSGRKLTGLE